MQGTEVSKWDQKLQKVTKIEKIFYGGNSDNEKKSYDSYCFGFISQYYEEHVVKKFSAIGRFSKIKENKNEKTPDFVSHDAKIVLEVKSINDLRDPFKQLKGIKIETVIKRASEKNWERYESYHKGVIVIFPILTLMYHEHEIEETLKGIVPYLMKKEGIDFVGIFPPPIAISFAKNRGTWLSSEELSKGYFFCNSAEVESKLSMLGGKIVIVDNNG